MKEKLLDFIKRRFPSEDKWTNGNCYWFAAILVARAKGEGYPLTVVYDPIQGHFYAYDELEKIYYDWYGAHNIIHDEKFISLKQLCKEDSTHAKRLMRDCVL